MKSMLNAYKILNHLPEVNKMIEDNKTPPLAVEIDLTNLCNHHCIWCMFDRYRDKNPDTLKTERLYTLLEELKSVGVKAITYVGGGEPTLHKDFSDILYKSKELGFDIGLVTNGELLLNNIQCIKDNCKFCRVSLDAGSKTDHQKLHGSRRKSFKRILDGIKALGEVKGDLILGVAFLVHPANFLKLVDLVNVLPVLKVDYLQVRPVYMPGLIFNDRLKQKMSIVLNEASLIAKENGLQFISFNHRFREFYEEDLKPCKCLAHNLLSIIGADGKVYLCCQLRGNAKFAIGDIYKNTFQEIWQSQQRQDVINEIDISRCPPCRYKKYNEIMDYLSSERGHENFL